MRLRKGQFIFNLLRPYLWDHKCEKATFGSIPYANLHQILFNIRDEKMEILEHEYRKYKIACEYGLEYKFPEGKFLGDSPI